MRADIIKRRDQSLPHQVPLTKVSPQCCAAELYKRPLTGRSCVLLMAREPIANYSANSQLLLTITITQPARDS